MEKYCKGLYFIDIIIEEISTHIDNLENVMKKNPKLILKNKKLGIYIDIDKEIDLIMKETCINFEIKNTLKNAKNTNLENNILETKNINWLQWYRYSCAFDSFIASFVLVFILYY